MFGTCFLLGLFFVFPECCTVLPSRWLLFKDVAEALRRMLRKVGGGVFSLYVHASRVPCIFGTVRATHTCRRLFSPKDRDRVSSGVTPVLPFSHGRTSLPDLLMVALPFSRAFFFYRSPPRPCAAKYPALESTVGTLPSLNGS